MAEIEFSKTQGLGNDFIIIDGQRVRLADFDLPALAVRMCDRNFGIGADGLILIRSSRDVDFKMQIINSDGSEAEMCGNGIRCFARYLLDHGKGRTPLQIETLAGIKEVQLVMDGAITTGFKVNMGLPRLDAGEIPVSGYDGPVVSQPLNVDGQTYEITCVSMGNPHCVIFTDSVDDIDLCAIGPKIETHPAFTSRTNVEFVQVIKEDEVKVRVWERGCGITLACGTGACASVVAGILNGKLSREVTTHLPGGDLLIEWAESGEVQMSGPAEEVFTGKFVF